MNLVVSNPPPSVRRVTAGVVSRGQVGALQISTPTRLQLEDAAGNPTGYLQLEDASAAVTGYLLLE